MYAAKPSKREHRVDTMHIEHKKGDIVWDIRHQAPALWRRLDADNVEVDAALRDFTRAIPISPTIDPFDSGPFIRPARHLRAFYYRLDNAVVAIKGSEIYSPDLQRQLDILSHYRVDYPSRGRSLLSILEHFPIVEQKIPLAFTRAECEEDIYSALSLQQAHLTHFGELARLPVPLLMIDWPRERVDNFAEQLLPRLTPRSQAIVRSQLDDGLATLIYHYPQVPLRVAHMHFCYALDNDYQARIHGLCEHLSPRQTLDRWLDLSARILTLGYMPGSIESVGIGHCLEAQNAVVDGGFVDLGSIKAMVDITTQREFMETLMMAFIDLSQTIHKFMLGSPVDAVAEYRNPSPAAMLTCQRVSRALWQKLTDYNNTRPLDPRLARLLDNGGLFDQLDLDYRALYPPLPQSSAHTEAGRSGTG